MEIKIVISDRLVGFVKRNTTRRRMALWVACGASVPLALYAADALITFQPNSVISSEDVNANFSSLDERIAVYEDGITVDEDGHVGIGMTSPQVPLDVSLDGGEGLRFRRQDTGTTYSMGEVRYLGHLSIGVPYVNDLATDTGQTLGIKPGQVIVGDVQLGSDNTNLLQVGVSTNTLPDILAVTRTGNVGIGTTSPACKLDARGGHYVFDGTTGNIFLGRAPGYANGAFISNQPEYSAFGTVDGNPMALFTNNSERARIGVSGNVSIGSTNTSYGKLHIYGGSTVLNNNNSGLLWFNSDGTGGGIQNDAVGTFSLSTGNNTNALNTPVLTWNTSGNVGIGTTTPEYTLDVAGYIRADNVSVSSDARLKRDIAPLEHGLEGIECLQGVTYTLADPDAPQDVQIGLIAQEVEACYPELVSTDAKGYKSVAYDRLVAPLIEAVKEQQVAISEQQQVNAGQEKSLLEQQRQIRDLHSELAATNARLARLEALLGRRR